MKVHKFKDSKALGDIGERLVKDYLESVGYRVSYLSVSEQRKLGYDLRARNLMTDKVYGVEVKTDIASKSTGNLFIETKVNGEPGWLLKYKPSSMEIIVFVINVDTSVSDICTLLFVPVKTLVRVLNLSDYPYRELQNLRYRAGGHIVPVKVIADVAMKRSIVF